MVNQLPQGWKEEELGKLVDIFDNLRKPVSSTERLARIKIRINLNYILIMVQQVWSIILMDIYLTGNIYFWGKMAVPF